MTTEGTPAPTEGPPVGTRVLMIPQSDPSACSLFYIYHSRPLGSVFVGTCKGCSFQIGLKFQGWQRATPAPMVLPLLRSAAARHVLPESTLMIKRPRAWNMSA